MTTLLVIANLAAFAGGGMIRFRWRYRRVEREIIALEAELPKLKEINAWATRAKQCLEMCRKPMPGTAGQMVTDGGTAWHQTFRSGTG
ncbi:hypothetical protein MASR1M12_11680 [Erysipelotrichia bacterium]